MKIKRLIAFLLIFLVCVPFLTVDAISEPPFEETDEEQEEQEEQDPFPTLCYYEGRLIWQGPEEERPVIEEVVLTVGDSEFRVEVEEDGYFIYEILGYDNTAIVSIPDDDYYIPANIPPNNNKVFISNAIGNEKNIYFTNVKVIEGRVATYDETSYISNAVVTCYRFNEYTSKWDLWNDDIISPRAVTTTDSEGKFSFKVINGEYRLEVKKEGYEYYNSLDYEYVKGGSSLINTNEGGMLNPVLHLTEIKVLKLLDTYPQNEGYIAPDDIISLYFDKRIIENSVKNDPSKLRLQLASGGPLITCTITVTGSEIKIKPKVKLTEKYNYKLFISKDILASDGSSLTEDKEIAFSVKSKDGQGPKQEEHDENNNQNDINKPGDEQPDTNDDLPIMADLEQHWAKEYVNKLVAKGVVNGIKQEDGSFLFYPDNQISRQEFAKMIISSSNHSLAEPKDLPFADNALIADWAKPYVSAAYQLGLIKGVKEENGLYFYPDKSITRAEIMTIIGRFFEESDADLNFKDWEDVPDWAKGFVSVCVEKKIVSGYEENGDLYIKPLNNITRAEAATIITKLLEIKSNED